MPAAYLDDPVVVYGTLDAGSTRLRANRQEMTLATASMAAEDTGALVRSPRTTTPTEPR